MYVYIYIYVYVYIVHTWTHTSGYLVGKNYRLPTITFCRLIDGRDVLFTMPGRDISSIAFYLN